MSYDHYASGAGTSPYPGGTGYGPAFGHHGAYFSGAPGGWPAAGYAAHPGYVSYPGCAAYPEYAAYPGHMDGSQAMSPSASQGPGGVFTRGGWFNFSNGVYVKGLLIGAATVFVLTHPTVQRTLIRGAVTAWSGLRGGMEEFKEHVQDVKAEMGRRGSD